MNAFSKLPHQNISREIETGRIYICRIIIGSLHARYRESRTVADAIGASSRQKAEFQFFARNDPEFEMHKGLRFALENGLSAIVVIDDVHEMSPLGFSRLRDCLMNEAYSRFAKFILNAGDLTIIPVSIVARSKLFSAVES